nr:hypothetical protein [Tanacetum cinerariifolium]
PDRGARGQPPAAALPPGFPQRLGFAGHELERHRRQDRTARHHAGVHRRRPAVSGRGRAQ